MLTATDLANYNTGFELGDFFGRGRIKELLFDLKLRAVKDEEEIETWRSAYLEQSKAVKALVEMKAAPTKALQDENTKLQAEVARLKGEVEALKLYSESLERKIMVGEKISTNIKNWVKEETA